MTREENVQNSLVDIAQKYVDDITEQLAALPRESKTERKALKIAEHEASLCVTFAKMRCAPDSSIISPSYYELREYRVFGYPEFEGYREWYENAGEEDRHIFLIYAHAIGMIKNNFYHDKELKLAKESGDVTAAFEYSVIVKTLDLIMNEWRAWWKENGCIPCEV